MRWPWQRERIEPPAGDVGGRPPQQGSTPPRVPPAGWAFLPPLQRTTGTMQLVSGPDRFTGALAAWGDPSFTGRMSHLVSAAAPPGIIDVDGGGPVRGDSAYPPPAVEMTLLPPPAPGSRPALPKAGNTGPLQRSASDGGPSEGTGGPVGRVLTAAAGTFPVLQLHASPPEQTSSHPEPEAQPSGTDPATLKPALPAAGDSSGAAIVPPSGQPDRTAGSTSDGTATYVPLPPLPVQRAQPGTQEGTAALWKIPPASKLGLGMPLTYSEPADPPESPAARALRSVPPPVQRSAAPEPAAAAPAGPSATRTGDSLPPDYGKPEGSDGNFGHGPDPAGTSSAPIGAGPAEKPVPLPLFNPPAAVPPTVPLQATEAGVDAGAGDTVSRYGGEAVAGPGASERSPAVPVTDHAGEGRYEGTVAGQEDQQPPAPSEPTVAPLLSAGGLEESIRGTGSSDPRGTQAPANESGTAALPVVSRFGPAATTVAPGPDDASGEHANTEGAIEEPPRRGLSDAHGSPENPLAVPVDTGWQAMPQNSGREPVTGQAPAHEPPASNAALPLQRTAETATGSPLGSPSAPVSNTTQHGNAAAQRNATPHDNATAQRALVFRTIPTATAGSTPDSLQRLTDMPATPKQAPLSPRSLITATSGRAAPESASAVAPDALPSLHDHPGPGPMSLRLSALPATGNPGSTGGLVPDAAALQLSVAAAAAWPVEPSERTAAVGRSLQRTLAPAGAASTAGGEPKPPPASWPPAGPDSTTDGVRAQSGGGRGPVNLQRSAAGPSNAGPGFGNASGPAVLALALQQTPYRAGGGSTAPGEATAQRDAAGPGAGPRTGTPGTVAGSVEEPSTAASENVLDAGASVQADAGMAPAGAAMAASAGASAGAAANNPAGQRAAGAPAATPEQLEELAKRLTGPLIRRIKAEMLLDRERRGLRTDVN